VKSRSNNISRLLCGILTLVVGAKPAHAQMHGMHGPRWGFAVASAASKDLRHPRLTRTWNPTEDLDSVLIVMGRSKTAPVDSIRILIKSGPSSLALGNDLSAAAYRSDSLGQWLTVPKSLLHPGTGERNVPMPMRVLGVFSPSAMASWARSQSPSRPVVTRMAADVWRRNTFERAELYFEAPTADPTAPARPRPKLIPAKPVRK
jgi:hypothetical protein